MEFYKSSETQPITVKITANYRKLLGNDARPDYLFVAEKAVWKAIARRTVTQPPIRRIGLLSRAWPLHPPLQRTPSC